MVSFARRLTIILILISMIPVCLSMLINGFLNFQAHSKRLTEQLQTNIIKNERLLENHLDNLVGEARFLAQSKTLRNFAAGQANKQEASELLGRYQEQNWGKIHHVMLANATGSIVVSPYFKKPGNHHLGQSMSRIAGFQQARQKSTVTGFFGFEEKDHYHQLVMYPVRPRPGSDKAPYVLIMEIEIHYIQTLIAPGAKEKNPILTYILTDANEVVVRNRADRKAALDSTAYNLARENGAAIGFFRSYKGKHVLAAYKKSQKYPWLLAMEIEAMNVYRPALFSLIPTATGTLLILALCLIFVIYYSRSFTRPLENINQHFAMLGEGKGDLTLRFDLDAEHDFVEMHAMKSSLNKFLIFVAGVMNSIVSISDRVSEGSQNLKSHSDQMQESAQSISASMEEASAATEELRATTHTILDQVHSNNETVQRSMGSMEVMKTGVEESFQNLNNLNETTQHAAGLALAGEKSAAEIQASISAVEDAGNRINEILSIINEISEKTNLLALNASIEAARAAEHGRGFAVVANEISHLAENTVRSVNSIADLVAGNNEAIQITVAQIAKVSGVLKEMASSIHSINSYTHQISDSARTQMDEMKTAVQDLNRLNESTGQIKIMSDEQTLSTNEIANGMSTISESATDYAEMASMLNLLAQDMKDLSRNLKQQTGNLKTV